MGICKSEACYVGDTISRDVRGVRNAGWPMMIQIENPRIYYKDEKYRGMGYKPDVLIHELPELTAVLDAHKLKEGIENDETKG